MVTGADDDDHLQNLAEVLRRLQINDIGMKKNKCHFMETSIVYKGCRIDSEGLHTTADKVEAMVRVPILKNVQELHSILGLKLLSEVLSQYGLTDTNSEITATARMQLEINSRKD